MIAALVAALALQASTPAAEPVRRISTAKIILVGDSTTAATSGWGSSFCGAHVNQTAVCLNLARGGRSTSSFRAEGSWDLALSEMSVPGFNATYVLIQFGHNDQPGKPGRSTDLETEFPANLRRYVEDARARGAVPILVTPLARRLYRDGQLQNSLEPWAEAVRRVGEETGTPVVDLNASSVALLQEVGPEAAARFAPATPLAPSASGDEGAAPRRDPTHLGREGADVFATLVTRDLIVAAPAMRRFLVP